MATGIDGRHRHPACPLQAASPSRPSSSGARTNGIDWGAADGPANLIFMIVVPDGAGDEHLKILASLSRSLMRDEFRQTLLDAREEQVAVDTIVAAAQPERRHPRRPLPSLPLPHPRPQPAHTAAPAADRKLRFVGVTSCPTGIAHTYMAAESLEQAMKDAGHEITVESPGRRAAPRNARGELSWSKVADAC